MSAAVGLAEALRRVLTLVADHISPDEVARARRVLERFDDHQRRLAAYRAGRIAQRRAPRKASKTVL